MSVLYETQWVFLSHSLGGVNLLVPGNLVRKAFQFASLMCQKMYYVTWTFPPFRCLTKPL